jgi:hypothetical protein
MGRSVGIAVIGLFLLGSVLAGTAGGATTPSASLTQPDDFDRTVFDVTVFANGTAEWVFEHRHTLDSETDEQNFRTYAESFEATETPLYADFVNQSEVLARVGSRQTDRDMTARNHSRSASVDSLGQTEGVVRMSFEWTNFATVREEGPVVADVFEGGLVLGEDQRLVFQSGADVGFDRVQPDDYTPSGENLSSSESVTFFGPREFADRRPRVAFSLERGTDGGMQAGPQQNYLVVAGLLAIVLAALGALAWRFDVVSTSGDEEPEDAPTSPSQPPAVKSDSERVLELLAENEGRMKQVEIVERTDWSKSKVSMLLSDIEEDGEITKLRVGRENIVSLSGEEPDAAGSPFEDEP